MADDDLPQLTGDEKTVLLALLLFCHRRAPARFSLETGATLAIMESGFLTALRTGLAGAPLTYWLALRRGQWPLSVPVRKAFLVRPIVRSTQPQPVDLPATNHPLLAAVPDELLPLPCSSDQSVCRGSGSP